MPTKELCCSRQGYEAVAAMFDGEVAFLASEAMRLVLMLRCNGLSLLFSRELWIDKVVFNLVCVFSTSYHRLFDMPVLLKFESAFTTKWCFGIMTMWLVRLM